MRTCLLLVSRNQASQLPAALKHLQALNLPVLVVDDGSTPMNVTQLNETASQNNIELVRLLRRSGQGTATKVGLDEAQRLGYTHALQCDIDIEFAIEELEKLLKESEQHPDTLYFLTTAGNGSRRMVHSLVGLIARTVTLYRPFLRIRGGLQLYPTALANQLLNSCNCSSGRMFSVEFAVRWYWRNLATSGSPITIQNEGPPPRFDLGKATSTSARLALGMMLRLPLLMRRHWMNKRRAVENA